LATRLGVLENEIGDYGVETIPAIAALAWAASRCLSVKSTGISLDNFPTD
jgi:hypothetical protein